MAIFTSNAPIFLPRYSGVRPTISPAMKTASTTNRAFHKARADAAKIISPSWMFEQRTSPPSAVKESCMEFTAPQEASVVIVANNAELKMPKRTSLPSMLPSE